ncbi:MAG: alpha/beta fold hydrolase [Chloroflexi bacterium]|nr:alpha/beta fold hydrolase [Chloroflexota bacterium]
MAIAVEQIATRVGKVQVRRSGEGDPLVYLHSAAGEGEGLTLLDDLAARHEVIAPMFPGFGESEGIEQIDGMEDAVFHLLDLFDQLKLAAPALMGLSLGGWMAAELATRYPDRVSRLILVNPAGLYIKGAEIKDIFGRAPSEMAADLFADQSHPMAQMMRQVDRTLADSVALSAIPFELIRPQLQALAATARLAWNPYLHNPKLRPRLERISVPTLVVRGAHDTLIPAAHAQAYVDEIAGAKLQVVPNAAHLISVERPAELAAIVNDFLAIDAPG